MDQLTVVEIKDELRQLGLATSDLKAQLINRLLEALKKENTDVNEFLKLRTLRNHPQNDQQEEPSYDQDNSQDSNSDIVRPEDSASQTTRRSRKSNTSNRSMRSSLAHERAEIAALMIQQARFNEKKAIEFKKEELELQTKLEIAKAKESIFRESESIVSGMNNKLFDGKTEKSRVSSQLPRRSDLNNPASVRVKDLDVKNPNLVDTKTKNNVQESKSFKQSELMQTLVSYNLKSLMPKTEIFKFDGDFTRYQIFIRAFETLISDKLTDEEEKLYYLEQYTTGSPREIVRACLHMDPSEGYKEARRLLERRYGDSERIATAYVNKVLEWKNIKADDVSSLDEFSIMLTNCKNAVTRVKFGMNELENPKTMRKILEKLPYYMQERWRRVVHKITESKLRSVNFNDIVEFIDEEARIQSNPLFGRQLFSRSRDDSCDELKQRSYKERIDELSKLKVCFSCLRKGHISKNCKTNKKCEHCSGKHPTLLHRQADEPFDSTCKNSSENDNSEEQSTSVLRVNSNNSLSGEMYRMSVIPIKIKANNGKSVITYAFMDPGSSASFCTLNLLNQLGVSTNNISNVNLFVSTINSEKAMNCKIVNNFEISDLNETNVLCMPPVYSINEIPISKNDIISKTELINWPHLSKIEIPNCNIDIGLMIGNNVPKAFEPLEIINSKNDNDPFAVRTRLGWYISGVKSKVFNVRVNRLHVDNIKLDQMLTDFYNNDFVDVNKCERGYSEEDRIWLRKMESECIRFPNESLYYRYLLEVQNICYLIINKVL